MTMDVKETGQSLLGQDFVGRSREESQLNKDDFLKLLLCQMQNQDPLSPQDSQEYMSQLAELSSLEHLQNLNDSVNSMAIAEMAATNSQTVNYIGKTITASGNQISIGNDGKMDAEMYYEIGQEAESVDITITDSEGKTIKTITVGRQSSGRHKVEWDGLDENGNPVKPGNYSFDVAAVGSESEKVEAAYLVKGKITGVTYESGYPELMIGDIRFTLGAIVTVDDDGASPLIADQNGNQQTPLEARKVEQKLTELAIMNNPYNMKK